MRVTRAAECVQNARAERVLRENVVTALRARAASAIAHTQRAITLYACDNGHYRE